MDNTEATKGQLQWLQTAEISHWKPIKNAIETTGGGAMGVKRTRAA